MKPGPTRIPSALNNLHGNPSKRKPAKNEPKPEIESGIPLCPAYLKGAAKQEWKRMAPELYNLGLLTKVDHAALEGYCSSYGLFIEAEKYLARIKRSYLDILKLREKDPSLKLPSNGMVSITSNGNAIMEPMLSVRKQAAEMMHKFLTEFGMTPASRARISVEGVGKKRPQSPMEKILEGQREMAN